MTTTATDLREYVLVTLTDYTDDHDVDGIVAELRERAPADWTSRPLDEWMPAGDDYWAIIRRHALPHLSKALRQLAQARAEYDGSRWPTDPTAIAERLHSLDLQEYEDGYTERDDTCWRVWIAGDSYEIAR